MSWNFFSVAYSSNRVGCPGHLLPVPDEAAKNYVPKDIISGEGVDEQRNIFGKNVDDPEMRYSEFERRMLLELDESWGESGDPLINTGIEETQKMRFLHGSSWDVQKAMGGLRRYAEWRNAQRIGVDEAPDRMNQDCWLYFYGKDRCHRPVMVIDCALLLEKWDTDSLTFVQDTLVEAMTYFVDHLAVPGHVEQVVVVADMNGCSSWNTPIEEMEKCAITLASRFRGRLNKLFILNVPLVFYAFWSIIKVFIPLRTLSKIHIHRGEYIEELLKFISDDQIDPVLLRETRQSS